MAIFKKWIQLLHDGQLRITRMSNLHNVTAQWIYSKKKSDASWWLKLKKNKFNTSSFLTLLHPHNVQLKNPGPIGYTCYMIALSLCYTSFDLSAFLTKSEKIVLFSLEYHFGHIILFLLFVFWTGHKLDVFQFPSIE